MRRVVLLLASLTVLGCGQERGNEVVVYTSHDRNLSEPVLNAFEEKTGIDVRAVYDTEANKTTGLVNRLIAEKQRPQADVFWNNEVGRTIILRQKGVLASYHSPGSENRPEQYTDPDGYWTGFAARARVLIVNTDLVAADSYPASIEELSDPRWKGRAGIADPHFGTTGTHFAALVSVWGRLPFRHWLQRLKANEVQILPGNAQVRDKVASGELAIGLTDTDDANAGILDGKPIRMVIPDQETGSGVFVIPNTVSLVRGGPNPESAKRLIDFLLSSEVEGILARGRGAQIPLLPGVAGPSGLPPADELHHLPVKYRQVAAWFYEMLKMFEEEWPS